MSIQTLQTQPICPKCKKGHTMKIVAFDVANQQIFYQTDCRIRPLAYSISDMISNHPEAEAFHLTTEGWMTYISTHGNYAHQLTADVEENAYALSQAYQGRNGVVHPEPVVDTLEEDEFLDLD